jgi:hypothetical protein
MVQKLERVENAGRNHSGSDGTILRCQQPSTRFRSLSLASPDGLTSISSSKSTTLPKENRVFREQIGDRRLHFTDDQRRRLAVRAKELSRSVLGELANIVERNHQGLDNQLIRPNTDKWKSDGVVHRKQRLGGTLSFYHGDAA